MWLSSLDPSILPCREQVLTKYLLNHWRKRWILQSGWNVVQTGNAADRKVGFPWRLLGDSAGSITESPHTDLHLKPEDTCSHALLLYQHRLNSAPRYWVPWEHKQLPSLSFKEAYSGIILLAPFALVLVQQFPCRLPLRCPHTKPPATTVHVQSPVANPFLTTFPLPTRWEEQIAIGFERDG